MKNFNALNATWPATGAGMTAESESAALFQSNSIIAGYAIPLKPVILIRDFENDGLSIHRQAINNMRTTQNPA